MPRHKIVYLPIDELVSADRNAKAHDMPLLAASLRKRGFVESIVRDDRTGKIIGGHGRRDALLAAFAAGDDVPDGVIVKDGRWLAPVETGWASVDDDDALATGIALNRSSEAGGWHYDMLAEDVQHLALIEGGLDALGYAEDDADLLRQLHADGASAGGAPSRDNGKPASSGDLLALVDVTIGEPEAQPAAGSAWYLRAKTKGSFQHVLAVADVMTGHAQWKAWLTDSTVLVPYPGPYTALAAKAADVPLLLVQPDPYVAGHIIDKFRSVNGAKSVTEVTA